MVMTQATTMLRATPHRTAEARLAAPTPMTAPGDRVSGGNGDAKPGCAEQRDGTAALGTESLDRRQMGDPRAHGAHDAPAAAEGAKRHGRLAAQDNPKGHMEGAGQQALGNRAAP